MRYLLLIPAWLALQAGPPPLAPPPLATGVILGQVVDGKDGKPIPSAVVSVFGGAVAPTGALTPPASPRQVIADGSGRFMFYRLPRGSFLLSATATGYSTGSYGQTTQGGNSRSLMLGEGQKMSGAVLRLWKTAAISGSVLDEAGEPMPAAMVQVQRRAADGSGSGFAGSSQTDDRGSYRVSGLQPGTYVVSVRPMSTTMPNALVSELQTAAMTGGPDARREADQRLSASGAPAAMSNGIRVGDFLLQSRWANGAAAAIPRPSDNGKLLVYAAQYYPAARLAAQAGAIRLSSGDDVSNIDLHLQLRPAFTVSGTLVATDGSAARLGVKLFAAPLSENSLQSDAEVASTATDGEGKFTFLGVPEGSYVARVLYGPPDTRFPVSPVSGGPATPAPPQLPSQPTLYADAPVVVGDADVRDVSMTLRAGPRVTGRIVFDGALPVPQMDRVPPQVAVTLQPLFSRSTYTPLVIVVGADGTFTSMSLPPGKYLMRASAPRWTLRSIMAAGVNIAERSIELRENDANDVVVTFFDRPAEISGTVRNTRGEPEEGVAVVVLPARYREMGTVFGMPVGLQFGTSSANGTFRVGGILPGDHIVAAISNLRLSELASDAEMSDLVARAGTRVTLTEGQKHVQDFVSRVVTIR